MKPEKGCVTCTKFNTCKLSIQEYDVVKGYFPGDSVDDRINRADWMKEKFCNCKGYVKSGEQK